MLFVNQLTLVMIFFICLLRTWTYQFRVNPNIKYKREFRIFYWLTLVTLALTVTLYLIFSLNIAKGKIQDVV